MAIKRLHQVQLTITKDVASGEIAANCQAIATLPEIDGTRFGVSLPVGGEAVASLMESTLVALKEKMQEGGHTVENAQPVEDAQQAED